MANVDMISHKVAAQAVHSVIERELDDLKSIVSNSFDQIQKSFGRQLASARHEAEKLLSEEFDETPLSEDFDVHEIPVQKRINKI